MKTKDLYTRITIKALIRMETERPQSEYNMSFDYIQKINYLLWVCSSDAIELNIYHWFLTLKSLYRTLSSEMTEKETERMNEIANKINKRLFKFLNFKARLNIKINPELYHLLEVFETDLYKILKRTGLLIKIKESVTNTIGRGDYV